MRIKAPEYFLELIKYRAPFTKIIHDAGGEITNGNVRINFSDNISLKESNKIKKAGEIYGKLTTTALDIFIFREYDKYPILHGSVTLSFDEKGKEIIIVDKKD